MENKELNVSEIKLSGIPYSDDQTKDEYNLNQVYEYLKEFGTPEEMEEFTQKYGTSNKNSNIKEITKLRENALVVQSNNLIEASQNLTGVELRIVYNLISYLNPKTEEDFETTKISYKRLAEICNLTSKDYFHQITKACDNIMRKPIIIKTTNRNGDPIVLRRTWFIQLDTIGGKDSYVLYKFHPDLTDELLQLTKYNHYYTSLSAQKLTILKDEYPMRLFQLVMMNNYKGMAEYTLNDIVDIFQLQGKYMDKRTGKLNTSLFLKKVFQTSVDRINEVAGEKIVDFRAVKLGKKVDSVQIFFLKTGKKNIVEQPTKTESVAWRQSPQVVKMLKKMEEMGFSVMYKSPILNKFNNLDDFMTACNNAIHNLTATKNNPSAKHIDNDGAFLFTEIMSYDKETEKMFAEEERAAMEEKEKQDQEIETKIFNAQNWEEIIKLVAEQSKKEEAIKILEDAAKKRKDLLKKYKDAYSLTFPGESYDIDVEKGLITLYGMDGIRETRRVNYDLLKSEKE